MSEKHITKFRWSKETLFIHRLTGIILPGWSWRLWKSQNAWVVIKQREIDAYTQIDLEDSLVFWGQTLSGLSVEFIHFPSGIRFLRRLLVTLSSHGFQDAVNPQQSTPAPLPTVWLSEDLPVLCSLASVPVWVWGKVIPWRASWEPAIWT